MPLITAINRPRRKKMQAYIANATYHATNLLSKIIKLEAILRALTHARYFLTPFIQRAHSLPQPLIVSLTSYPPRFATAHLTIKTLLSQSIKPDKVILWIYETDLAQLPTCIKQLQGMRFEVRTVSRDLRSYKKIVPTVIAFSESYIVTADDDIYYNHDWLAELIKHHDPSKKCLVGHRGHKITYNNLGSINNYVDWRWCIGGKQEGCDVFLTSGGGILFPPHSLPPLFLDENTFMKHCSTADDIWIHITARMNGYTFKKIPSHFREFSWGGSQSVSLNEINVGGSINDRSIEQLQSIFGAIKEGQSIANREPQPQGGI